MSCSPLNTSVPLPDNATGSPISGFGIPFALKTPTLPTPSNFPEDLLEIFDNLNLLIPPGALKPSLNPNYGKDIFDGILKLMDQFFPFLMLYKFFLPVLNLIICIIEVLCSISNPFKLIRAMRRLFRNCIPEFLNLFPVFALVIMIVSLLLLLLSLIDYIETQLDKFVTAVLRNVTALQKAFNDSDQTSVLAIVHKLGMLLCSFQNFFVLFALFNVVITIIKDLLGMTFAIPPCDDSNPEDLDGCCTPDVCPAIIKESPYTRKTGTLQYLNQVDIITSLTLPFPSQSFNVMKRAESWQIFDENQNIAQKFINIIDGYDIPSNISPKPIFFPTDATYSASTAVKQAAYTVDLRLLYNPTPWHRTGVARYIRFKDCIVLKETNQYLLDFENKNVLLNNGVISLAGGLGYEDDGTTILTGFTATGDSASGQATLNNFLHMQTRAETNPNLYDTDGYVFSDLEYTFKPNVNILLNKNIITAGCEPTLSFDKTFINQVYAGDISLKTNILKGVVNNNATDGTGFPDVEAAQQCMLAAVSSLRSNLTTSGVADFKAMTTVCMNNLRSSTVNSLIKLIEIGVEPCNSDMSLNPATQFTTKSIKLSVILKDKNNTILTNSLPSSIAPALAKKIKAYPTFGSATDFVYDGYSAFTSEITADATGTGTVMVSFDDNMFCTNTIPADNAINPSHTLKSLAYTFIHTTSLPTSTRRDESDISDVKG